MSYLGTRRKLVTFAVASRLVEDSSFVYSNYVGMIKYLLETRGRVSTNIFSKSLANYLTEASNNSIYKKYERAYQIASSPSHFYGLPKAKQVDIAGTNVVQTVKTFIETFVGQSVSMKYAYIGDANYYHFMWKKLIEVYGYNPTTNELTVLSAQKGFACYLSKAEVVYGSTTQLAYESQNALTDFGFSSENGACLTRNQDLTRAKLPNGYDANSLDAYVEVQYKYIEIIPDTVNPDVPIINNLSLNTIDGYAEKNSSVEISVNNLYLITVVADGLGFFTHTFTPSLISGDLVEIKALDSALNASAVVSQSVPYTNISPVTEGSNATITAIERTENYTFNYTGYIASTVEIPVADVDEPPTVVNTPIIRTPDIDYIQASYSYINAGITYVGYLTYAYGSNTNNALENLFNSADSFGEFYPRLFVKRDSVDLSANLAKNSAEYNANFKIARALGMQWEDWAKNVKTGIENSSEDFGLEDVTHAFQACALPMNTQDSLTIQYMLQYWERMYLLIGSTSVADVYQNLNAKSGTTLEIKDATYNHVVSYGAVSLNTIVGSIGSVGHTQSGWLDKYNSVSHLTNPATTGGYVYVPRTQVDRSGITKLYAVSFHYFRLQITPTTYKEIRVFDCQVTQIFSNQSVTATGKDEYVLIPTDRTIVNNFSLRERELLTAKSIYLFVDIAKIVKIKWYKRSGMRFIGVLIAVLILVFTKGAGAKLSSYILAIVKAMVFSFVLQFALKIAVKLGLDPKLVAIITVVILIASGYANYTNTEILGLTAVDLLGVASFGFSLTSSLYSQALVDLNKEKDLFNQEVQNKLEQLKEAKALIGNMPPLPFELLLSNDRSKVFINLGETPEEFMSRMNLNVIDTLQSFVSDYVSIKSEPPTIQQMIEKQRGLSQ